VVDTQSRGSFVAADKPNPTKTNLNLDVEIWSWLDTFLSNADFISAFLPLFPFRPLSTSGTTQFAILYNGSMCVYDGIPAEKVNKHYLLKNDIPALH